jgi:hypothetical protein
MAFPKSIGSDEIFPENSIIGFYLSNICIMLMIRGEEPILKNHE